MKKIITGILCICMFLVLPVDKNIYASSEKMQAAWVTTVYNQDWPKTKNNVAKQKEEMITLLDTLKDTGINTIMFQARTEGDALYASSINPWSKVLTGTQGQDPGYDPLEFVIEEAKKRGISVHVWLNPYRVTTSGTDYNVLSDDNLAKLHPEWTLVHNGRIYYNPEVSEVKQLIIDTVAEIVTNYDIDGVHFDDYFYPTDYPLPEGEGKDGDVANARRDNITEMIKQVQKTIKSIDSSVQFGVSPRGIWKNNSNDLKGSNTTGKESYYSDYADTRKWVKENLVDYIVPQVYWQRGLKAADYETVVSWWADVAKGTNVKLYIGQGIYKDEVAVEIDEQLKINEKYSTVLGSVYFSSRDIVNNREGAKDKIKVYNSKFKDIIGTWAENEIREFINLGYIQGYEDGTFKPDGQITRAEFVSIVNKVYNKTKKSDISFTDVKSNKWYYEDIRIAVGEGYINGRSEEIFDPEAKITREEVAKILTIVNNKVDISNKSTRLTTFDDAKNVSNWAIPYMEAAIQEGYITGYTDNTVKPQNNTTRAESVVMINRAK